MKQLSGIDASFLYMETPETPMHVAGFNIYELPEGFKGSFHKHFTEFFAGRVHLVSIFNVKLAKAVFELDHPGWVDAGPLDFDHHIKSAKLPALASFADLEAMVADLHSQPLDLKKPLWQFTVIEGLKNNQVAIYSKVHHALVDGGAGMEITQALFDLGPIPREVKPPEPKPKKRVPTKTERAILGVHDMAANVVRQNLTFMEAIPQAMGQMAGLATSAATGKLGLPQLMAPKTPFNGSIGQKRSYCARTISLMDVKAIGKASGTKVNDVVMAICSGALRNYLNDKHQLPDASLTAFVPISTRTSGKSSSNNQVFGMNCPLATNYSDPLKRLQKIHAETGASKTIAGSVQDISPKDFTLVGAPTLLPAMMSMYGKTGLADILPNAVNVTISNTAGPPFPMFCAGAKLLSLYPVSIPIHGIGLNLTVQSYLDHLDFGLTADYASVPDLADLGDLLVKSFEELRDVVLGPPAKPAPKRKPSTKKQS
ncbi:MAG: wax ester/triacylglycerol synthase family O-acyltransferase [Pseudomonadota bacterium]